MGVPSRFNVGSAMRSLYPIALVGLLAACTPAPPHLQSGGGFGPGATGYNTAGTGYGAPAPGYAGQTAYGAVPGAATGPIPSSEINSALFGASTAPGAAPVTAAPAPLPAQGGTAVAAVAPAAPTSGGGLSDEQDFAAVSSRVSIEADKARIEANKAQYVQIQPGALPERPGEAVSPVIAYVISAPNGLGQAVYNRRAVKAEAHAEACQRYATDEAAQEAFLNAGGPNRDPKKLDPDGDGWACKFDPTPYRRVGN